MGGTIYVPYCRYKAPPGGGYSVCTVESFLAKCFTELVFCGLCISHVFPLAASSFSYTVTTMEGNGNSLRRKEVYLFLTLTFQTLFFFPTAKITTWPKGKSGANLPTVERLSENFTTGM